MTTALSIHELLAKYDVPGPRYTSYPTVPIWSDTVNCAHYATHLSSIKSNDPLSLYFHLPFCEKLCHFCGCMQVITKNHSVSAPYIETLKREIDLVGERIKSNNPVSQLHFGGGTPNFIQPNEMRDLMQKIRQRFSLLDDAEIAIEMHPRTSTKGFCEMLADQKFNRISLGVQDFDDHVQKLINRHQTYAMTKDMVLFLRSLGFENFNFDLIYGLPGQTLKTFEDTLHKTLELSPDRLAVYSYAHVPWVRPVQRSFKDDDLPTPQIKLELFEMALKFFSDNGYIYIGMDHFAKKTDELAIAQKNHTIHRNFMGYSTRADAHQIGMGVSSISYVDGQYFQNLKKLEEYSAAIDSGNLATHRGCLLNGDDKIRRALITDLMCHFKIEKKSFAQQYQINFDEYFSNDLPFLASFQDDGLLVHDENEIRIIGQGYLVVRNIAMCFDKHLDAIRKKATNPVFSRTV